MLKVLSWNIQAGGGSRYRSIVKSVVAEKASIVAFSEFRNNESGIQLRSTLLKAGYRYQAVTAAKSNENSVLIAAIMPFDSELHPNSDEDFPNNIISAHFTAFSVMSVYLPHKKKHKLLPFIKDLIASSEKPYIVAGDYNTGINLVDQKGKSFWYEDEFKALSKVGYLDAFRLVYGDVKEYSWYSHQGNGFRYDHTYISEDLKPIVKDCYYKHEWREGKLSDHSPMILELG